MFLDTGARRTRFCFCNDKNLRFMVRPSSDVQVEVTHPLWLDISLKRCKYLHAPVLTYLRHEILLHDFPFRLIPAYDRQMFQS